MSELAEGSINPTAIESEGEEQDEAARASKSKQSSRRGKKRPA
jgi:hypothetical protein